MPPSKSSKAKAAWAKARQYAEQQGVSIKEARTLLARQKSEPKAVEPKASKAPKRLASTSKPHSTPDLAAAERALRVKYPHIVEGSIRVHQDGPHRGRRTVEIVCQGRGCQNRRRIHSSDAFQTLLCLDCTKVYRSERRAKARKKGKQ